MSSLLEYENRPIVRAVRLEPLASVRFLLSSTPLESLRSTCPQTNATALFYSVQRPNDEESLTILDMLVEEYKLCDVNQLDRNGQTALFFAARDGNTKTVRRLIEMGCDPNTRDSHGQTPVFYAARDGRLDTLLTMIDYGSQLNVVDVFGQTAIFYAAREGRLEIVKAMIEGGADASIRDKRRQTAAAFATRSGHTDVANLLRSSSSFTPMRSSSLVITPQASFSNVVKAPSGPGGSITVSPISSSNPSNPTSPVAALAGALAEENKIQSRTDETKDDTENTDHSEKVGHVEHRNSMPNISETQEYNGDTPNLRDTAEKLTKDHEGNSTTGAQSHNGNEEDKSEGSLPAGNTSPISGIRECVDNKSQDGLYEAKLPDISSSASHFSDGALSSRSPDTHEMIHSSFSRSYSSVSSSGPSPAYYTSSCSSSISFDTTLYGGVSFSPVCRMSNEDDTVTEPYRKKYRLQYRGEFDDAELWLFAPLAKIVEFERCFPELAVWSRDQPVASYSASADPFKKEWYSIATELMQELCRYEGGWIFEKPVDVKRLNCPDYYEVVKNPMDFGGIKSRLRRFEYDKVQQFLADVQLVFDNCHLYNKPDSWVALHGTNLEAYFNNLVLRKKFDRWVRREHILQATLEHTEEENQKGGHNVNTRSDDGKCSSETKWTNEQQMQESKTETETDVKEDLRVKEKDDTNDAESCSNHRMEDKPQDEIHMGTSNE